MELPRPSEEQQAIVKKVCDGYNVKVDAVAGSGKTTTILHIAKRLPSKRILLITYNRRLKEETREKARQVGADNLEVHSYHAFCVKYFNSNASRDQGIVQTLFKNTPPRRPICFDIIVIDEAQDMKPLYFNLTVHIIKNNIPGNFHTQISQSDSDEFQDSDEFSDSDVVNEFSDCDEWDDIDDEVDTTPNKTQLCIFGDVRQNIYAFQASDQRYLSMADIVFPMMVPMEREWIVLGLKTSFRVTREIADFVNKVCLGDNRILAIKNGPKPKYLICNSFGPVIMSEIKELLRTYEPSDFFIVGPSIRNKKGPLGRLENKLVQDGQPCYVPISDDAKLEESDCAGKIVFSTIHQVKGLERKVVILFSFDESYFTFFNRDAPQNVCPNEIYVALTRAKERLILVHHCKQPFMPFLRQQILNNYVDKSMIGKFNPKASASPGQGIISVIDCIRHIKIETITKIQEFLKTSIIVPSGNTICIPTTVTGTFGTENVADVNGTCLPAIYELFQTGTCTIFQHVYDNSAKLPRDHRTRFASIHNRYNMKIKNALKARDFLYVSNLYQSLRSGYQFKVEQISDYNWLPTAEISKSLKLMRKYISPAAIYEKFVMHSITSGINRVIQGSIDIIDFESPLDHSDESSMYIWEIKCVQQIDTEHILQLVIYAWMIENNPQYDAYNKKYYLLNVLKDEIIELHPTDLTCIVQTIIDEKFASNKKIDDEQFLSKLGQFGYL